MNIITNSRIKSAQSINQCESVMQTIFDIVKAHGRELKGETEENTGSEFIILLAS